MRRSETGRVVWTGWQAHSRTQGASPPSGDRRMSANPHANGGSIKKALRLPRFTDYAVKVEQPGTVEVENVPPLGTSFVM